MREHKPTNKSRIMDVFRSADGEWVRGARLLHPEVGGSRFGARIEELRRDGFNIERRRDPNGSALHQYRLVSSAKRIVEEAPRMTEPKPEAMQPAAKPILWRCSICDYQTPVIEIPLLGNFSVGYCPNEKKKVPFKRVMMVS